MKYPKYNKCSLLSKLFIVCFKNRHQHLVNDEIDDDLCSILVLHFHVDYIDPSLRYLELAVHSLGRLGEVKTDHQEENTEGNNEQLGLDGEIDGFIYVLKYC